jgi:hypothetical protein
LYFTAGVAITAVILTSGLFALKNNNKAQQQVFMRLRVGAQAITVLAMMASLGVQERQKALGLYRRWLINSHKNVAKFWWFMAFLAKRL